MHIKFEFLEQLTFFYLDTAHSLCSVSCAKIACALNFLIEMGKIENYHVIVIAPPPVVAIVATVTYIHARVLCDICGDLEK